MPKITIKKFVIAGQLKEFGIWYTDTDKFFIKDFDSNVGGIYNWRKFGHGCETQAELYEKADAAIKEYEETIAQSKKVILLKLTAARPHLEKYSNGSRDYKPAKILACFLISSDRRGNCDSALTLNQTQK